MNKKSNRSCLDWTAIMWSRRTKFYVAASARILVMLSKSFNRFFQALVNCLLLRCQHRLWGLTFKSMGHWNLWRRSIGPMSENIKKLHNIKYYGKRVGIKPLKMGAKNKHFCALISVCFSARLVPQKPHQSLVGLTKSQYSDPTKANYSNLVLKSAPSKASLRYILSSLLTALKFWILGY